MADAIGPGAWVTGPRPTAQAVFVADWTNNRQLAGGGAILYVLTKAGRLVRPDEADPLLQVFHPTYAAATAAATAWMNG